MHHYSGVTSVFNKRRPNWSTIKPFDPNHPRYLHCWCCYAHTVIRTLAALFTLATICRTVITFSYGANMELNAFFTSFDLLGTIVLALAVFYECGEICPICTYVCVQTCNMCCILYQMSRVDSRGQEIVIFGRDLTIEVIILIRVCLLFWIGLIMYSIKILINYAHFLTKQRSSEERYRQRIRYAERKPEEDTSC